MLTIPPDGRGNGLYSHHVTPAGARAVPVNPATGKRTEGDWEFHYNGWKDQSNNPAFCRAGSTRDNIFPEGRPSAKLDAKLLEKMGLTPERMKDRDALFFHQLLLPMCDPSKSGIDGDPRKPFYTEVATCTNLYAIGVKGGGGDYGHAFRSVNSEELLNWDGIVIRNLNKNLNRSWVTENTNEYDPLIASTMPLRRFLDIKGNVKLCVYTDEKKRGDEGYDCTQKYGLVWDVTVFNLNQLLEVAGLDTTVDETTWGNASYADVQHRLKNKPYSKGGQHTLLVDSRSRYIYGYTSRHKFWKRSPPFTAEGPAEIKRLLDDLTPLVVGEEKEESDKRRQIFPGKFCLAMDNHFSGDVTSRFIGENGFKSVKTNRRDRLPAACSKDSFHHRKDVDHNAASRMARFAEPIIAVCEVRQPEGSEKSDYRVVHVSFQSTGSTNIQTVNALSEVGLFVEQREKGKGETKRYWAIEMNEARQLYLKLYGTVDRIDQMLKEWGINYITWRWWHAPMRHGKGLALSMAYQMYSECAAGDLNPLWKVDKPMRPPEFAQRIAEQMCNYRAKHNAYPGDKGLRNSTKVHRSRRGKRKADELEVSADQTLRVSYDQYLDAKNPRGRDKKSRLCSDDLGLLKTHINSMKKLNKSSCQVCGKPCWMKCTICNKTVCLKSDSFGSSLSCCIDMHDDNYFGLTMDDRVDLFGELKKDFKKASATEIKNNKAHIAKLKKKKMVDDMKADD